MAENTLLQGDATTRLPNPALGKPVFIIVSCCMAASLTIGLVVIRLRLQAILATAAGDADTVRPALHKWVVPIIVVWGLNFASMPLAVIGLATSRKYWWVAATALTFHIGLFVAGCLVYPL
jgi:hypothetical protein